MKNSLLDWTRLEASPCGIKTRCTNVTLEQLISFSMTITKHLNIKDMLRSGTEHPFDSRLSFKSYIYLTTFWPSFIFWPELMTHNGGRLILWITWQRLLLFFNNKINTNQEGEKKKKHCKKRTSWDYEDCHVSMKLVS